MTEATTYPCQREAVRCPALRAHLWEAVSREFGELAQCTTCGSMFETAPRCPYCGAASRWLAAECLWHKVSQAPFDPVIAKAAHRMPQIVREQRSSVVPHDRLGQCRRCGSAFLAASRCPYCGSEKVSLDEGLPVGDFHEDYDNDGNLRENVRTEGRPRYRPVFDNEIREQLESEFEDSGRPNLYEDVQNYLSRQNISVKPRDAAETERARLRRYVAAAPELVAPTASCVPWSSRRAVTAATETLNQNHLRPGTPRRSAVCREYPGDR